MRQPSAGDTDRIRGLFVREMRPASKAKGVFLLLHGTESHSGWFVETASQLVGKGWAVAAFDRSGCGQSPGIRGHLASYRDFVEETAALASELRGRYDTVHLAGMSWGGMAALYLGLRRGWLFDSISLLSPGLAAKKDLSSADKLQVARAYFAKDPTRTVEPQFLPEDFTASPDWQRFIADDPLRLRHVTASFCVETLKMRRFIAETAGRRRLPHALCLLAERDPIIDNRKTADICLRAGVQVETMPAAVHTLIFDSPAPTVEWLARHADEANADNARPKGRVWVIGGGAVGGAVASLLSFQGVETGVLVRDSQAPGLSAGGFTIQTGHGSRSARKPYAASTPDALPADPDLVLLAVKSFDTAAILSQLAGALPPATVIGSLQNGVGNEDAIAAAFPRHTVLAGSVCAGLELLRPGHVLWADDRGGLAAACHRGDGEAAREVWTRIAPFTGMECPWYDGDKASARLKWSKLMLNIGFNALNSLTGLSSSELLRDGEYGALALRALREGFAVMRRLSLDPVDLPGFPVSKLSLAVRAPIFLSRKIMAWHAGRAAEAAFSMRQDIIRKRQHTEINELNGIIVEAGKTVRLATPANEKLVDLVEKFSQSS